jgi:hypothetical protein
MLQNAVDVVAGDVLKRLRRVVEGGDDGVDRRACLGDRRHVADVDEVQRSFADAEDEAAAFFEADVRGSFDEVAGETVSDASEGAHRAGENDHCVHRVGAGGDGCADVFVSVVRNFGGGLAEEAGDEVGSTADLRFLGQNAERAGREDEVDAGDASILLERAEHLNGKYRSTCSGHRKRNCLRLLRRTELRLPSHPAIIAQQTGSECTTTKEGAGRRNPLQTDRFGETFARIFGSIECG